MPPLRAIVMLVLLVGSLPVCFVRPFYGIVVWTIIAFLHPQSYLWGANLVPWALVVAVPTLAGALLFSGWGGLRSGKLLLLAIMWIWFVITSVLSANDTVFAPHSADTWQHLSYVSKVLLMTFVTVAVIDSFERLRIFVIVIASCFGFYVLKSLPFIIITGGAFKLYGPSQSMIADNNDFGLALNMTLPLFLFLAQAEADRRLKWLFGFFGVITIPAIFFTYSRGALFGLVVIGLLMVLRVKGRILLIPGIVIAVIIAVLFAPASWQQRMNPDNAIDESARERFNAWTFSWKLANDFPVTGGGFSTFTPELFARYAPVAQDVHGPHSIYFGVLAEHGFPGLFLYLGLVVLCISAMVRLGMLGKRLDDPAVIAYSNMFLFSLVGFLVSGIFLGRAYFDYYFTIVACIVILEKVARDRWSEPTLLDAGPETEDAEIGGVQCVQLPS